MRFLSWNRKTTTTNRQLSNNRLIRTFVLGGIVISSLSTSSIMAQCGYAIGLGCANTDYNNFGAQSNSDAATIEYDNYVGGFHSTLVREYSGEFKVWGERTANNGSDHNYSPTVINASNFSGLTGTPLKATMGSNAHNGVQTFVLTSDNKIWVWGTRGAVLATSMTSNNTKQSISLPSGVAASEVKSIFATTQTLAILTCESAGGHVYVLTQTAAVRGTDVAHSASTWQRVRTGTGANGALLSDVVALRGCATGFIALKDNGTLWTWGNSIYLGNGSRVSASLLATSMTLPTGVPSGAKIKMIGATGNKNTISYYLLYDNGWLYSLGENGNKQLGVWNSNSQTSWVRPLTGSASGSPMNNIQWISPNEHDFSYPAINVITKDSLLLNWGAESGSFLGRTGNSPTSSSSLDPGTPASLAGAKILAVETGGHTTMVSKMCEPNFGYVGHKTNGSMGDGSTVSGTGQANAQNDVTFNTAAIQPCGATTTPTIDNVGQYLTAANGTYCNNQTFVLEVAPSGGTLTLTSNPGNIATLTGNNLQINGVGTVTVTYSVRVSQCSATPQVVTKTFTTAACNIYNVKGTVWNDINNNGIINSNENGVKGKTSTSNGLWANLVNNSGLVVSSVPVGDNGTYELPTVQNGTYSVSITNGQIGQGVTIPSVALDVPDGWTYTGNNKANSNPCLAPSCATPYTITNVVVNSSDVSGINFGLKATYNISGAVFNDGNGLNGTNPTVDGTPIYGPQAAYTVQNNAPLYILALDPDGNVIHYVPVTNNGTYSIDIPLKEEAILQLNTIVPTIGQPAPAVTLPRGWNTVGESFGNGNAQGSGVNDGTGSGNNALNTRYDGAISVGFSGSNTAITNVNFGIQQAPTATAKNYMIASNGFISGNPSGYPFVNNHRYLPMSSSLLVEVNSNANGSLSGTDAEDCPTGNCNSNAGGVVSVFTIGVIRPNTELYYSFGGSQGVQKLTYGQSIPNFDYSKLVIYGEIGQGASNDPFGFTYALTDKAGIRSAFVNYLIETSEPLPLVLLSFTGYASDAKSWLNWTTTKEENIKKYDVLHSKNGQEWNTIGTVAAQNLYASQNVYQFIHEQPLEGNNLYRLGIHDQGKINYSSIVTVMHKITERAVYTYPNPTDDVIFVRIPSINDKEKVVLTLTGVEGVVKKSLEVEGQQTMSLSTRELPAGVYILKVTVGTEQKIQKIIKN